MQTLSRRSAKSEGGKLRPPGLAKGVDTTGEGGYAIWWRAAGCRVLCSARPAPWPDWLLQALLWRPPEPVITATGPATFDDRRLDGVLRKVKFAPESERNSILYWGARRLGETVRKGEINSSVAGGAPRSRSTVGRPART